MKGGIAARTDEVRTGRSLAGSGENHIGHRLGPDYSALSTAPS
jgi:hypothetical protein